MKRKGAPAAARAWTGSPRHALLLLSFAACACPVPPPFGLPVPVPSRPSSGSAEPTPTPDAPFRVGPPAPAGSTAWTPPRIESWSMPNGVRVLLVERHELPIVGVRVVSGVGAGDLPAATAGVVAFMGAMLEQGAGTRDAPNLSDDYEALGADHSAWCDWDACVARVRVLASHLVPALNLLADVVRLPTFPPAEIERTRKRWLGSLQLEKSSPPAMEQNALAAALYGRAHPYGHALRGAPADVIELKRDEIEQIWRRAVQPCTATIVVAGDVAPGELRPLLEARFASWRDSGGERDGTAAAKGRGAQPAVTHPPRSGGESVKVVVVDVPGAAQSQVYVAQKGAPFGAPDRIALGVMNAILGGMFSSRINLDLRETRAYTYGAHSRFSMRHGSGPFAAGGAIFTEHTGDAVRAVLAQISRIVEEPVIPDELADEKENAKLALPARFEGVDEVAGALQDLAVYDLPLDEYGIRSARIDAVTTEDVQRVAKKWLHPDAMLVVVTGDRAKIEKDLASVGPIEIRDAYGDPVK